VNIQQLLFRDGSVAAIDAQVGAAIRHQRHSCFWS
jgi:hypothetical protein